MMEKFFPLFINLKNKKILIIGAGLVALRKTKTLLKYEANIKVISPQIKAYELTELKNLNKIKIEERNFIEEDLQNIFMLIAATDDEDYNFNLYKLCQKNNILCNNVSSKNNLDVRMPAIYEDKNFQVAVSSYGEPKKSQKLRDKIKNIINSEVKMKKIINTKNAPAAIGPYSQAIEVNGTLYVSGQIPFVAETMQLVSEDVSMQTEQSLKNIEAILKEAGYNFEDVVKATVFIKDMNDFAKINEVYAKYLGSVNPARACVEVARLPKDVKVEIEVIAVK